MGLTGSSVECAIIKVLTSVHVLMVSSFICSHLYVNCTDSGRFLLILIIIIIIIILLYRTMIQIV